MIYYVTRLIIVWFLTTRKNKKKEVLKMTKQAKSGKYPIHTLPEDIQKSLESFWEPITSASYCGNFVTTDGGRVICVPTFLVNKTRYVYVIDALDGLYTYEDVAIRQERQRKFGKSVNKLMEEYGFSWELGKVIINTYDIKDRTCLVICHQLQEAKEDISNGVWAWKKQFVKEPKQTMQSVIGSYSLDYWLNTSNPRVFKALSNYLFATN